MSYKTFVSCYSAPLSETTIPVEDKKHLSYGRKEIHNWLWQLQRTFPEHKDRFKIREQLVWPKDPDKRENSINNKPTLKSWFVSFEYEDDENDLYERELAFAIVDNLPYCWDDKAREHLGRDYFDYIMRLKCPKPITEEDPENISK